MMYVILAIISTMIKGGVIMFGWNVFVTPLGLPTISLVWAIGLGLMPYAFFPNLAILEIDLTEKSVPFLSMGILVITFLIMVGVSIFL